MIQVKYPSYNSWSHHFWDEVLSVRNLGPVLSPRSSRSETRDESRGVRVVTTRVRRVGVRTTLEHRLRTGEVTWGGRRNREGGGGGPDGQIVKGVQVTGPYLTN